MRIVSKTCVVDSFTDGTLNSTSDPLPFQFWHRYTSLSKKATFVDVDYPQLIEKKRDRMLSSGILRDALLGTKLRTSEPPVYLHSDQYMAIGCDLKELNIIESILRAEFDAPGTSFLFVAEVSVTYMPTKDADALIRWASTLEAGMSACSNLILEYFLITSSSLLRTRTIPSARSRTSLRPDHAQALRQATDLNQGG